MKIPVARPTPPHLSLAVKELQSLLVIAALGYRPRALPVLDEAGRAVRLHSLTGPRAPLVDGQCRVKVLCESLTMSALLSLLLLVLAGCGLTVNPASFDGPTGTTAALDSGVPIQGHVGGEQWWVRNATIQLCSLATKGIASAASALLTQPVLTDTNGNFSIAEAYSCPSPTSQLYSGCEWRYSCPRASH
jgi:hypothetical protein